MNTFELFSFLWPFLRILIVYAYAGSFLLLIQHVLWVDENGQVFPTSWDNIEKRSMQFLWNFFWSLLLQTVIGAMLFPFYWNADRLLVGSQKRPFFKESLASEPAVFSEVTFFAGSWASTDFDITLHSLWLKSRSNGKNDINCKQRPFFLSFEKFACFEDTDNFNKDTTTARNHNKRKKLTLKATTVFLFSICLKLNFVKEIPLQQYISNHFGITT